MEDISAAEGRGGAFRNHVEKFSGDMSKALGKE
jgi:hypothetical protein